ncbi:MAG: glycosyltransferase [Desulfobacteraceae bacterium]|jgi:glycosyltransferase involved in cell wall biosynthesis
MTKESASDLKIVTILGSLPPLRALSSYCLAFTLAVSRLKRIEFISFKSIYPSFLYPGGVLREDHTFPVLEESSNLRVKRNLTWYNPLTWIVEGIFSKGQILHAQWWSPPLIFVYIAICSLYKLRRRPVVLTVHNIVQHEKKILYNMCSRILFKLSDHFIVHSGANKDLLTNVFKIEGGRISVIPHGPLFFQSLENIDRDEARREFGLDREDKVILFFGAIRAYKGLDIALNAFAEVLNEIPEARLVIAGRLWQSWDRYENIIRKKNISEHVEKHLHYIDTDEVAKYFLASDLVILPYLRFDSQSGVGATAVAYKKPMIVTKTGGLPELVMDQENVVPPGDIKALSDRIIYCLKNRSMLKRMSQDTETIAEGISWERIAAETVNIYEKLINEKISI